jgi:hypothetical protein
MKEKGTEEEDRGSIVGRAAVAAVGRRCDEVGDGTSANLDVLV